MKIYGYARISTAQQNIERQVRNITNQFPNAFIIREVFTGTSIDRPEWKKFIRTINAGDKIIFDSVSRMSRNAKEGFKEYEDLFNKGVDLVFLKEPHINTSTYKTALKKQIDLTGDKVDYILKGVNQYLMALAAEQIRIAFEQSEKEVADLRQRTKEGIETARRNGKQIGQRLGNTLTVKKEKPIKEIIFNKSKDFNGHNSDKDVMAILSNTKIKIADNKNGTIEISAKLSRNTYYKYKNDLFNVVANGDKLLE